MGVAASKKALSSANNSQSGLCSHAKLNYGGNYWFCGRTLLHNLLLPWSSLETACANESFVHPACESGSQNASLYTGTIPVFFFLLSSRKETLCLFLFSALFQVTLSKNGCLMSCRCQVLSSKPRLFNISHRICRKFHFLSTWSTPELCICHASHAAYKHVPAVNCNSLKAANNGQLSCSFCTVWHNLHRRHRCASFQKSHKYQRVKRRVLSVK